MSENNQNNPLVVGGKRFNQTGSFYDSKDTTLEAAYRSRGHSDPRVANASVYWGFNYLKTGSQIQKPRINQGYVFFTKPRLRLTYHNLRKDRTFTLLENSDKGSMASIVRAYLDPVSHLTGKHICDVVNPRNPFITMLSNQCLNLTGWSEIPVDAASSRAGLAGEVHTMADGHAKFYGNSSLSASFENINNDLIGFFFHIWTQYMMHAHKGVMIPYPDDLLHNRINYNTRIYRFLTDLSGEYLVDWNATGAAFPISSSKGQGYDYDKKERMKESFNEVSIQFNVNGYMMLDPYVLKAFNMLILMYNPRMANEVRSKYYVKLSPLEKPFFNYHAIPFIELRTAKLTWWVDVNQYKNELLILNGGKKK